MAINLQRDIVRQEGLPPAQLYETLKRESF